MRVSAAARSNVVVGIPSSVGSHFSFSSSFRLHYSLCAQIHRQFFFLFWWRFHASHHHRAPTACCRWRFLSFTLHTLCRRDGGELCVPLSAAIFWHFLFLFCCRWLCFVVGRSPLCHFHSSFIPCISVFCFGTEIQLFVCCSFFVRSLTSLSLARSLQSRPICVHFAVAFRRDAANICTHLTLLR